MMKRALAIPLCLLSSTALAAQGEPFSDFVRAAPTVSTPTGGEYLPLVPFPLGVTKKTLLSSIVNLPHTSFYVQTVAHDGDDAHDCLSATVAVSGSGPCATVARAIAAASIGKPAAAAKIFIDFGQVTPQTHTENITFNGPLTGGFSNAGFVTAGSMPIITLVGAGSGITTIAGGNTVGGQSFCYALLANGGALVGLDSIAFTANAGGSACLQSDIYAQFFSHIYIIHDVKLGVANGFQAFAEEYGDIEVQPGGGASPGLTFSGNAVGAVGLSAYSAFQADTSITFTGNVYSGEVFDAEFSSIKLSGNPPTTGSFTGTLFNMDGNAVFATYASETWPGSIGIAQTGAVWKGAFPAPTLGGATNLGANCAGGGCVTFFNADPYRGTIRLSPSGAGVGALGAVSINFPYVIGGGACVAGPLFTGTGVWQLGTVMQMTGNTTQPTLDWSNGLTTALTAGQTYDISYICR